MAIAYNNSASGAQTTGTSYTVAYTVSSGSDRLLLVGMSCGETAPGDVISGITYNGVAMTKLGPAYQTTNRPVYLFGLLNPATGANNIVSTRTTSGRQEGAWADYTGVSQSGYPDASVLNGALSGTTKTRTLTTVADNCWMADIGFVSRAQTAGANTIIRQSSNNTWFFDSNGARATGSNSLITTQSDSTVAAFVTVSFAPAVAASTFRPRVVVY